MVWLGNGSPVLGGPTMTATLDRDTIRVGETATLTLSFEGGRPNTVPSPPPVPDLTIQYAGKSENVTIVQGQYSAQFLLNYLVTPARAGEFAIPAFKSQVDRSVVASNPLKLSVLKNDAPSDANNPLAKLAFLKLIIPKDHVYVGELIPVELDLYLQGGRGQDLQMPQIRADGFTVGKLIQTGQSQSVTNNSVYLVVSFKMAVAAVKTGALNLGPAECSLVLQLPRTGPRRGDFFDLFGQRMDLRQVNLASQPLTVQVLPFPAQNVPAGFSGAVGQFQWAVSAGPTNVAVGDPITLKVQVAGRGALGNVNMPLLDNGPEFKVYPPASKVETTDPLGMEGTKNFEQVVVPQTTGVKALPSISFAFFDPDQRSFRTLIQPPILLTVRAGASPASPTVVLANAGGASSVPIRDIVHIKIRPGQLAAIQVPWVWRSWFWLLQGLPFLLWLGTVTWRKRQDHLERHPRLRRRRAVAHMMKAWLIDLRRLAAANEADEFFALLFRMLQEQLGERLDLPASAITEAVIDEQLRPRGVPEETLERLQELFRECDQVRFAPEHSLKMLGDLAPKVELVIGELQALSDPQPRGGS